MTYTLAFIMCLAGGPDAECRAMWLNFDTIAACAAMKRLVIQEAKDEGFTVSAVCSPLAVEVRQ